MKKIYLTGALVLLAAIILVCVQLTSHGEWIVVSERFDQMGTFVDIQIPCHPEAIETAKTAIATAREEISRLEALLSPYRPDSDVSKINHNAANNPVPVSGDTFRVVKKALEISELTKGAFDITFAPVGKIWGLDKEKPHIPSEREIEKKLPLVDYRNVILDERKKTIAFAKTGMEIGLGGIAKGTVVDAAIRKIRSHGINDALVNAGGDLYAMGLNRKRRPWGIGILHPRNKDLFITTLDLSNRAIVTSGDYERMVEVGGKRYHHILDPRTGRVARKSISVSVVAPDAETADALSTALFVMGKDGGLSLVEKLPQVEALIVTADKKIFATGAFNILNDNLP